MQCRRSAALGAVFALAATLQTSAQTPQPVRTAPPVAPVPARTPEAMPAQPSGAVIRSGLPPPPPILVLPRVPNVAAGYAAPHIATPNANIVGITQQPFVGITLQNAVGMALARNPQLAIAQSNRRIASYGIEAARGAYDVRLSVEPSFTYSKSPPQNAFFAGPNFGPIVQSAASVAGSASGTTPGGQQYEVQLSGQRINNNSTIDTFDPYYPTAFSAKVSQPLARNRGINDASKALQLAQIGAESTDADTLLTVSNTVAQVENTYWDLVAAWRDVAVQEDALREAQLQARSNRRLARAGINAPIEIVQSNTQVNVFQDNVFVSLQNVAALQNQLKASIAASAADPIWFANLVPTSPELQLPPEPSLESVVMQAMRNRPEMAQIRDLRRQAAVNATYAADRLKPQIDLEAAYSSSGFAGSLADPQASSFAQSGAQQVAAIDALIAAVNKTLPPGGQIPPLQPSNQPVPSYLVGGLGQSLRNLLTNQFPTYMVGLRYQFALGNRTAKAQYGIAREQEVQAQLQEANTIERITFESRNALQSFRTAEYRLIAARSAREAAQQVLASEQRRFRNGVSTTYLVLTRQVELADNRERELQAQTALNKAVVEIERVSGAILQNNGVDVTTVGVGAPAR